MNIHLGKIYIVLFERGMRDYETEAEIRIKFSCITLLSTSARHEIPGK